MDPAAEPSPPRDPEEARSGGERAVLGIPDEKAPPAPPARAAEVEDGVPREEGRLSLLIVDGRATLLAAALAWLP